MQSLEGSMAVVGAGLYVVDYVVEASKLNDTPPIGFALIRPPGSHDIPNAELPKVLGDETVGFRSTSSMIYPPAVAAFH
ncbi:hypothetical protein Tco_0700371 [Tanacetum coccineum]